MENSMDRGTWQVIVHGVTKSQNKQEVSLESLNDNQQVVSQIIYA